MSSTPEILTKKEYLTKHFATTASWAAHDIVYKEAYNWWINKTPKDVSSLSEPYYAPGNHDPPIPTAADIASAQSIDRFRPVYRIFGKYIAKRLSSFVAFIETESHLYLERYSNVKIPKLYAVFPCPETGDPPTTYYMILEYIPGFHMTGDYYKSLDKSLQEKAGRAIGMQLKALRAVPSPSEGYYGLVNNRGWPPSDNFLLSPGKDKVLGPYSVSTSYEEFVNSWYETALFRASTAYSTEDYTEGQLLILRNFKRIMLSLPESDRSPYLCHRDLNYGNIIFEEIKGVDGKVQDFKATLIDFESLCWLPGWMQLGMLAEFRLHEENIFFAAAKVLEPELNVTMGQWLLEHLMDNVLATIV